MQLALLGSMASDDPEGWVYLNRTIRHAGEDYDIHIPILPIVLGIVDRDIAAFQTVSNVVFQKSTREGFGLTVSVD